MHAPDDQDGPSGDRTNQASRNQNTQQQLSLTDARGDNSRDSDAGHHADESSDCGSTNNESNRNGSNKPREGNSGDPGHSSYDLSFDSSSRSNPTADTRRPSPPSRIPLPATRPRQLPQPYTLDLKAVVDGGDHVAAVPVAILPSDVPSSDELSDDTTEIWSNSSLRSHLMAWSEAEFRKFFEVIMEGDRLVPTLPHEQRQPLIVLRRALDSVIGVGSDDVYYRELFAPLVHKIATEPGTDLQDRAKRVTERLGIAIEFVQDDFTDHSVGSPAAAARAAAFPLPLNDLSPRHVRWRDQAGGNPHLHDSYTFDRVSSYAGSNSGGGARERADSPERNGSPLKQETGGTGKEKDGIVKSAGRQDKDAKLLLRAQSPSVPVQTRQADPQASFSEETSSSFIMNPSPVVRSLSTEQHLLAQSARQPVQEALQEAQLERRDELSAEDQAHSRNEKEPAEDDTASESTCNNFTAATNPKVQMFRRHTDKFRCQALLRKWRDLATQSQDWRCYHEALAGRSYLFYRARAVITPWRRQLTVLRGLEVEAYDFDYDKLMNPIIGMWRERAVLVRQERLAEETREYETQVFFEHLGQRAGRAYDLYIMGKALSHWAVRAQEEKYRTESARQHIMRMRYFGMWKTYTAINELKVQHFGTKKVFNWLSSLATARRQETESILQHFNYKLLRKCLLQWQCANRANLVIIIRNHKLRRNSFHIWHHQIRMLTEQKESFCVEKSKASSGHFLSAWRDVARARLETVDMATNLYESKLKSRMLACIEERAVREYKCQRFIAARNVRLIENCFGPWRLKAQQEVKARALDYVKCMREALNQWTVKQRLRSFQRKTDRRLVIDGLYKWYVAEHAVMMTRSSKDRLTLRVLRELKQRIDLKQAQECRNGMIARNTNEYQLKVQPFRHWYSRLDRLTRLEQQAEQFSAHHLTQRVGRMLADKALARMELSDRAKRLCTFNTWNKFLPLWHKAQVREHKQKLADLYQKARIQAKVCLVRRIFTKFNERAYSRAQQEYVAEQLEVHETREKARRALRAWKDRVDHIHGLENLVNSDQAKVDVLNMWLGRLQDLGADEARAAEFFADRRMHGCIRAWALQRLQLVATYSTAEALLKRSSRPLLRRVLEAWYQVAVAKLRQRGASVNAPLAQSSNRQSPPTPPPPPSAQPKPPQPPPLQPPPPPPQSPALDQQHSSDRQAPATEPRPYSHQRPGAYYGASPAYKTRNGASQRNSRLHLDRSLRFLRSSVNLAPSAVIEAPRRVAVQTTPQSLPQNRQQQLPERDVAADRPSSRRSSRTSPKATSSSRANIMTAQPRTPTPVSRVPIREHSPVRTVGFSSARPATVSATRFYLRHRRGSSMPDERRSIIRDDQRRSRLVNELHLSPYDAFDDDNNGDEEDKQNKEDEEDEEDELVPPPNEDEVEVLDHSVRSPSPVSDLSTLEDKDDEDDEEDDEETSSRDEDLQPDPLVADLPTPMIELSAENAMLPSLSTRFTNNRQSHRQNSSAAVTPTPTPPRFTVARVPSTTPLAPPPTSFEKHLLREDYASITSAPSMSSAARARSLIAKSNTNTNTSTTHTTSPPASFSASLSQSSTVMFRPGMRNQKPGQASSCSSPTSHTCLASAFLSPSPPLPPSPFSVASVVSVVSSSPSQQVARRQIERASVSASASSASASSSLLSLRSASSHFRRRADGILADSLRHAAAAARTPSRRNNIEFTSSAVQQQQQQQQPRTSSFGLAAAAPDALQLAARQPPSLIRSATNSKASRSHSHAAGEDRGANDTRHPGQVTRSYSDSKCLPALEATTATSVLENNPLGRRSIALAAAPCRGDMAPITSSATTTITTITTANVKNNDGRTRSHIISNSNYPVLSTVHDNRQNRRDATNSMRGTPATASFSSSSSNMTATTVITASTHASTTPSTASSTATLTPHTLLPARKGALVSSTAKQKQKAKSQANGTTPNRVVRFSGLVRSASYTSTGKVVEWNENSGGGVRANGRGDSAAGSKDEISDGDYRHYGPDARGGDAKKRP